MKENKNNLLTSNLPIENPVILSAAADVDPNSSHYCCHRLQTVG